MISTGRLVRTLGGKGVFRERQATFEAIIDKARTGFPYATLEALATRFEIPRETLVRILHLPPRTLARRKKAHRLSADESDRLLRLARVAARAEDVFGSQERAGAWLRGTVRAPASEVPANWRSYPPPEALADLGARWAHELKSPVFAVPSAVIPQEPNYLLNPLHSHFKRIRTGNPEAFRFDPRLRRR